MSDIVNDRVKRYLDLEFLIDTVSDRATEYTLNSDMESAMKARKFAALLRYTQSTLAEEMTAEEMMEAERLMGGEDL